MKTNKIVKAFLMMVAAFLITIGMTGCGNGSGSNYDKSKALLTAQSYCKALANKDFEKAGTYCTEGAAFKLETMNRSTKSTLASIASSGLKCDEVSINGNDAVVTAYLGETATKIYLEKNTSGKWLICNPEF